MNWFSFFLGTPRRFLSTLAVVGLVFGIFFPEIAVGGLKTLVFGVWNEVLAPLVQTVFPFVATVAVMYLGFRMILRGVSGGGRKR